MNEEKVAILYIKSGCPWCEEALAFFSAQGIDLDIRDVNENAEDLKALINLSGQTKTPTFLYDEFLVADFDLSEFLTELEKFPLVGKKLGILNRNK